MSIVGAGIGDGAAMVDRQSIDAAIAVRRPVQ